MPFPIVRIGLASAALAAVSPATAAACPEPMSDGYTNPVHVGAFVGAAWGTGTVRVAYGLDLRLGTGPVVGLVRVEAHGLSHLKLVGGANAVTPGSGYAHLDGEVGLAFRSGHADFGRSVGLHLGAGLIKNSETGLFVRPAMFGTLPFAGDRDNQDWGGGLWVISSGDVGLCEAVPGRPLRDGEAVLLPACVARRADPVAAYWIEAARGEASSVPSFVRLADELAAAGAPARLVTAARDAARDEVRHARICGGVAGGVALAPVPRAAARPAPSRAAALARLGVEAWREGCLGEGAAAAEAASAARTARDPAARRAQQIIAADEARHAELSWQVLAWAWRAGGAASRDAIAAAIDESPAPAPRAHHPAVDRDHLAWHGVPTCDVEPAVEAARRRALRMRTGFAS